MAEQPQAAEQEHASGQHVALEQVNQQLQPQADPGRLQQDAAPEQQQQQQQQQHGSPQQQQGAAASGEEPAAGEQRQEDPDWIAQLGNSCTLVEQTSSRRVWRCASFCGRPCWIKLVQDQQQQSLNLHPWLSRKRAGDCVKQDVAGMLRARKLGVATPLPLHTNLARRCLYMEEVAGSSSLQQLLAGADPSDPGVEQLLCSLGHLLAVMHDGGLVHGQLQPTNILVREQDKTLVLLHFEQSFSSTVAQEKAADLIVLEQSLQAEHEPEAAKAMFAAITAAYNKRSTRWSAVHNRLAEARTTQQKRQKKNK